MNASTERKRHLVVLLVLSLMLSLSLMFVSGCVAQGGDADGQGNVPNQAQQGESSGADSGGFVIEATAVVDVNIDEEGQ